MGVTAELADAATMDPVVDRPPFDELYRTQYARSVRLAWVLVDTREQAEEVVQDAFAAVLRRYDRLTDPVAYLRMAVLNGARKVLRRRRVVRRHLEPRSDPDAELGFNHVVDAVRRLPHRQRAAIVLRYELQLTDAEIAVVLDVPLGTVKSTLHRALARLRQEISP